VVLSDLTYDDLDWSFQGHRDLNGSITRKRCIRKS